MNGTTENLIRNGAMNTTRLVEMTLMRVGIHTPVETGRRKNIAGVQEKHCTHSITADRSADMKIALAMEDYRAKGVLRETWYVILELEEGFHVYMKGSRDAVRLWTYYALAGAKVYMRSTRDREVREWVQRVL